ncbi:hypothetical protein ACIRFH_10290 [Streptomyces sp. NPDC093586]|uniref:hypothetical protein n=1 Tax=Streptomyces sp. NPDC093586 TaxID=3366042 RepID=UPI00380A9356
MHRRALLGGAVAAATAPVLAAPPTPASADASHGQAAARASQADRSLGGDLGAAGGQPRP